MIFKKLSLKNIGPFNKAFIEFISSDDQLLDPPVIIVTGENGTGKSVILDSIRALFLGVFGNVERDITSSDDFNIEIDIFNNNQNSNFCTIRKSDGKLETNDIRVNQLFHSQFTPNIPRNFIFDYWTSKLSNDRFDISNIEAIKPNKYLDEALSGVHKNIDVSKIISFFDYLKDSKDPSERILGQTAYEIVERIISVSINDGILSHVSRIDLKPMIRIHDRNISLDKLSSGNLYLIQRLLSLLKQVYSICIINNIPIQNYKNLRGILLIDEAENHLHPKWQKVFLKHILDLFPKLQIIVSTHSPFIVSSVKNSRVFVCESKIDHSIINEETEYYSSMPVEEILLSPLFNTNSFNVEISTLLAKRKEAILNDDKDELKSVEENLLSINPEYFNFLNVEKLIKSIKK